MAAQHAIQIDRLLFHRQMTHAPHQVTQIRHAPLKPRLLRAKANLEVAFSVTRAIQGEAQKVNRFRAFSSSLARVPSSKATKLNERRLGRLQSQAELLKAFAQYILESDGILTILKAHHKVVDVAHQIRLAS
ncbi:MAG: hypothetical protein PF501_09280 [Salinisphaera sp.]|jgi:hypothetical protein|nr:hypothetical protein [Salinisphaera sp.]